MRQKLSRIRHVASLFSLLAICSAVCLCFRSLWLVSYCHPYHVDENAAASTALLMFHQRQHPHHDEEWSRGQPPQDARPVMNLTTLLERQASELEALRLEKKEYQQHEYERQIANLTATLQEQAIELETSRRHRRDRGDRDPPASFLSSQPQTAVVDTTPSALLMFNVERSTSYAIFYNIYIPPPERINTEKMDNALRIVAEQIHQVQASFALNRDFDELTKKKKKVVPLFYNTIGHGLNATWMNQLCTSAGVSSSRTDNRTLSLDCIFLNHYNQTVFEDVTLQRVLDYCQQEEVRPNHEYETSRRTVIYMHSKGSFNPRDGSNDVWRRHLTNAVTSRECLLATTTTTATTADNNKTCNVCGLLFNPMPGMHFPGNFFTARCDYIRQLPPPATFQNYMNERVVPQMLSRRLRKTLETNLYPLDPWMLGVDRWAFEWWIASHPSVVPCDVSVQTSIYPFKEAEQKPTDTTDSDSAVIVHGSIATAIDNTDDTLTTFTWAIAPRFSYRDGNWDYTTSASRRFVMRKPERRRTENALLAGHLFRWFAIYNNNGNDDDASNKNRNTLVVPPDDSWIWEWFPEGQFWRDQVRKYGLEAVNVTTAGFAVF